MIEIKHKAIFDGTSNQIAYDLLYNVREIQMRDSLYLWLIRLLAPKPDSLLLDISCGQGQLVRLAAGEGLRAMGIDISIAGISRGDFQQTQQTTWLVGDGEKIPLADASIDYITHIGSLEHYQNPLDGVREIARLLKPHGRACILLPNMFGLFGNMMHVWRHGEVFDDGQPLQRYGTRKSWAYLLTKGGLYIDDTIAYNEATQPYNVADLWWLLKKPQRLMRLLTVKVTPLNFTNHFVFLCHKAAETANVPYYPFVAEL